MKLKYKKMIIAVTMSAMGIGLITFSMSSAGEDKTDKTVKTADKETSPDSTKNNEKVDSTNNDTDGAENTTADAVSSELQENAYPEVNKLVEKYMKATLKGDMDTLKTVMTDTSGIDAQELQKKSEYIEEYKNISCYTKPGPVEGSYVVYVYSELKILNIDTLAPGLTRLYICTAEDGNLYIFSSEYDNETKAYIDATEQDEKVTSLINTVNKKLSVAVSSDADLKAFVDKLNKTTEEAKEIIDNADSNSSDTSSNKNTDNTDSKASEDSSKTSDSTDSDTTSSTDGGNN